MNEVVNHAAIRKMVCFQYLGVNKIDKDCFYYYLVILDSYSINFLISVSEVFEV